MVTRDISPTISRWLLVSKALGYGTQFYLPITCASTNGMSLHFPAADFGWNGCHSLPILMTAAG